MDTVIHRAVRRDLDRFRRALDEVTIASFDTAHATMVGFFFTWVQDGASPEEQAALRENVPGPVLTVISGLFGRRYRQEIAPVWARTGR